MLVYVQRNENDEIIGVSKKATFEAQEPISNNDPELIDFLALTDLASPTKAKKNLEQSDLEMIRVIEDLIDILVDKNIITFTDFPEASQSKILTRQKIRDKLHDIVGD